MSALFEPAGVEWSGVSPKLATAHRIVGTIPLSLVGLGLAIGAFFTQSVSVWLVLGLGAGAAIFFALALWVFWWAPRNQQRWGYAEHEDDLLVTHGILWRRTVAVPFGRMQFVDVEAGPLDRSFGFASVTLHTASTKTAAKIPGLPMAEAQRLRDRLTALGEVHGAGL